MTHFHYQAGRLFAESVDVAYIAETYGTPCYVYSRAALESRWRAFDDALGGQDHLICYAVKANSNLAVLGLLARIGSGFDIVSAGELERVLAAGGDPQKIVFSGVVKNADDMRRGLEVGILCFNIESEPELDLLNEVAGSLRRVAPVSIRVNPDVDAMTHPYISTGLKENKFGVPIEDAARLYQRAAALEHLRLEGVDCHIGSQLTSLAPYEDAMARIVALVDSLAAQGMRLSHLDAGGGLGIRYRDESAPELVAYAEILRRSVTGRDLRLIIEPGRAIVGDAGLLLTRVQYLKSSGERHFALVDAAMNDLLRPALYDAWHDIVPARESSPDVPRRSYDVVGPVCESSDFLGKERELAISPGDLLAVRSAGAYGFVMSSNYNTRPRAAEVMVDRENAHLVRHRETVAMLLEGETMLPG